MILGSMNREKGYRRTTDIKYEFNLSSFYSSSSLSLLSSSHPQRKTSEKVEYPYEVEYLDGDGKVQITGSLS